MEYGWNLWLKVSFNICTYITKKFIEIPPCAKCVIFITDFALLSTNLPFYEVKKIFWKRLCAWRNFKNIFSRPLFTIIFSPKIFHFEYVNQVWISCILGVKLQSSFLHCLKTNLQYGLNHDQTLCQILSHQHRAIERSFVGTVVKNLQKLRSSQMKHKLWVQVEVVG